MEKEKANILKRVNKTLSKLPEELREEFVKTWKVLEKAMEQSKYMDLEK